MLKNGQPAPFAEIEVEYVNEGDAVKPPPSFSLHISFPVSHFQHMALPSSVTAKRCPLRTHMDGT